MADLPTDLVSLPTAPWDERPTELPLDTEECRTALWHHAGNVTEAADELKVTPARLRAKIKSSPYLIAEQVEAKEQLKDIAEGNVREALTDKDDPGRRDSMTRFVLASIGRDRGYGTQVGGNKTTIFNGSVRFVWQGEDDEEQPGDNAKVVNG